MKRIDRREAFVGMATVLIAPSALLGCGKKALSCTDTAGLSADEVNARTVLGYVDASGNPAKPCSTCQLYKPSAPDQCGGCQIMKGPVNPAGSCKSWAKKA